MRIQRLLICLLLAASTLAWSCLRKDVPDTVRGFDFAMNKVVGLTVNYGADLRTVADGNGVVIPRANMIFDVYTEDPFTSVDRTTLKNNVSPILSVFTDAQGRYTGKMKLPIAAKKLWFLSNTLGVPRLIVVDVPEDKNVNLNLAPDLNNVAAVRSTRATYSYPSDFSLMNTTPAFNWNNKGLTNAPASNWNNNNIYSVTNAVFKKNVNLRDKYSSLLKAAPVFVLDHSQGAHTVILRFFHNDGTKKCAIGYYSYMPGEEPKTMADVQKLTLVFPNASYKADNGPFDTGNGVQLKYWDPAAQAYTYQFPSGCRIGFVTILDAFDNGTVKDGTRYYSNLGLGTHSAQQMAAFFNSGNNVFVCGVEYTDRSLGSTAPGDNDFSDLIFFVDPMPRQKGTAQIVPVDPKPEDPPVEDPDYTVTTTKGTLIFEDLWPWQGDYDINDVVLEYTCEMYVNPDNRVIKLVDKFRPVNCGATLQNGFAIEYGFAPSVPRKMTMVHNYPGGVSKTDVKSPYVEIPWTTDTKGYETGQSKACILLFDDIRRENANIASGAYTWTITTEFEEGSLPTIDQIGIAPYNPFIIVHHGMDDDLRNHEIHLANYKPTDKGTMKWFGTADDVSSPPYSYYLTNDHHPFAIDIPIHGFVLAPEKQRIETVYLYYAAWAASLGTLHVDWYMHPTIP